jgi:PEGA domain.
MIQSNPSKAKLYLDGAYVGETPYLQRDTKIVGSSMVVKLEKEGFKPLVSTITKDEEADVGAIIGGVFFVVPFLWTMKYLPVHNYELMPMGEEKVIEPQNSQNPQKSKADRLRELKKLLDDKIITQDEFGKEKAKILDTVE